MSFANTLKTLRLKEGYSLQEAADLIGISKTHFWDLETGRSKNPSYEILEKVSNKFGVSVATLVNEDVEASDNEEMKILFRQMSQLSDSDLETIKLIVGSKVGKS